MGITKHPQSERLCSSSHLSKFTIDHELSFFPSSHSRPWGLKSPSLEISPSGAQHSESSTAYFLWPPSSRLHGSVDERATYFNNLQKDVELGTQQTLSNGQQATTLLDLMTIRAFNSKELRRVSLGTAIGFRTRHGVLTDIPAIIVFVARKLHVEWLPEFQRLPPILEGPGGIWCDLDVVEFSYYGASAMMPKEQVYTELVEGLQGNYSCIGPGSQVASPETYGTLGTIVQSKTGVRQVGFLTNRHVAVNLDYPNQKMFHPLPPNLGPGVYLGAVERATSFIPDDIWYGIFASMNPETFVRADGAFIPFADSFDMSRITTTVKGVGDMGEVVVLDLQAPVGSVVGKPVVKVGRSSGLTKGCIMAYALECNDEKGICFFTDFLIVGDSKQAFDLEGDSGSLILMTGEEGEKPRPVGIIWGGTANRGRLKLCNGRDPESWTSGVDLERLLELLQLDLITSADALSKSVEEQRQLQAEELSIGEPSPRHLAMVDIDLAGEGRQPVGQNQPPQQGAGEEMHRFVTHHNVSISLEEYSNVRPVELELIKAYECGQENMDPTAIEGRDCSSLNDSSGDEPSFGLHLYERDAKRRRSSDV